MQSGQKIPGYSGFIPHKQEHVGLTTGESNKQAGFSYLTAKHPNSSQAQIARATANQILMTQSRSMSIDGTNEKKQKMESLGKRSKDSVTWVNGPNHEIRNQCIPGYTGFISGVKSENVFAMSYSNSTAKSFKNVITRGGNLEDRKRFQTTARRAFNQKRNARILESPKHDNRRDYLEYMMTMNAEQNKQGDRQRFLSTTGSFEKFNRNYNDMTGTTMSPKPMRRDLNGSPLMYQSDQVHVKPAVLESKVIASKDFQDLSENFKAVFTHSDKKDQGMRVPIVGYGGHRKGETSENMFAKNYRETTFQTIKQMRALKDIPDNYKGGFKI